MTQAPMDGSHWRWNHLENMPLDHIIGLNRGRMNGWLRLPQRYIVNMDSNGHYKG